MRNGWAAARKRDVSTIRKRALRLATVVDARGKEASGSSGFLVRNQMDRVPLASVTGKRPGKKYMRIR